MKNAIKLACICLALSAAGLARADGFPKLPANDGGTAPNVDPSSQTCPSAAQYDKCQTDLADKTSQYTQCDGDRDQLAHELAVCYGVSDDVAKAELQKPANERWKHVGKAKASDASKDGHKPDKTKTTAVKPHPPTPPAKWLHRSSVIGDSDCASGTSTLTEHGPDKNGNGKLDDGEVDSKYSGAACNGRDGATGATGAAGPMGPAGQNGESVMGPRGLPGSTVKVGGGAGVSVGLVPRNFAVFGAGEAPGLMSTVGVRLGVRLSQRWAWAAEGGMAPWGDNGVEAHTGFDRSLDDRGRFGLTVGLLGEWIGFNSTNHARAQAIGLTPGVFLQKDGWRVELTGFVGERGAYGDRHYGAGGVTAAFSVSW